MRTSSVPADIGIYRVERQLGEGGMGTVFLAVHTQIGRRVAIKVLHSEYARNPQVVGRFFNEARAVNIVEHPSVVQISDFGMMPDGAAYIVMEYLKGETLSSRLHRQGGRLPADEVLLLLGQIGEALVAAHDKGIVHRDLKPDNVMLVPDPVAPGGKRVKVLDFGIAKVAGEGTADNGVRTRTGMLMGTPVYMAPEQCRGAGGVTDRADVYSLGVMMYQALCGRVPFYADGAGAIMAMHIYEMPAPMWEIDSGVPAALAVLVHSMLAKDPRERPPMVQVVAELRALGGRDLAPPPRQIVALDPASVPVRPSTLGEATGQIHSRVQRMGLLLGGIMAVVLVVATSAGLLLRREALHAPVPPPRMEPGRPSALAPKAVANSGPAALQARRLPLPALGPAQPAPTPSAVRISLSVIPADAVVTLDYGQISTPFTGSFPPSDIRHGLVVKAHGYRTKASWLTFDHPQELEIVLDPIRPGGRGIRSLPTDPPRAARHGALAPHPSPQPVRESGKAPERTIYKGTKPKIITEFPR